MPFPTNEDDFPDDVLRRLHFFYLTTRCNAGLVLSDEGLPSRLEPKRRVHEETCCSRLVDAWPVRCLFATVEHLICLIAAPSTRCTVLVLLSNADKGGLHDGVSLLEGSVRRKNVFFFWTRRICPLIEVRVPCCSSCWPLVALVFVPINGSHWRFQGLISTVVVVLGPTLLDPSIICATGQQVLCGRGSCFTEYDRNSC
ncbi:hypothetical protein TcCL_ESM05968 [Trypanosoma cruzi]|nr:hypothetical protein TcCL_ESM05968 [Trypanosoma cruzi]